MNTMRLRLLFACLSLGFGCAVVGVSLVRASDTLTPEATSFSNSPAEFRVGMNAPIIPGHLLYPVRAASEKLGVLFASPTDRPTHQLSVAQERLEDAKQLIESDQLALATQTLVKGQQYLTECASSESSTVSRQHMIQLFTQYTDVITTHKDRFSDQQKAILDKLLAQNNVFTQVLNEQK